MRSERRTQALVVAAILVLLVVVAAGAWAFAGKDDGTALSSQGGSEFHPVAGNFEPDDTRLASCRGDVDCLEQAFGNLAYEQGPKLAIRLFERKIRESRAIEGWCHRIAHTIGSAALARYDGDVSRTFAEGSSVCNSGYYHGILERSFAGASSTSDLRDRATGICRAARIQLTEWLRYNCLHGLGHGLMIQTGYDLPVALSICRGLASRWARDSCAGGSFMENFFSTYGVKSRWLRRDDLTYPCNAPVARNFEAPCYLIVTARVLTATGYDWTRTAEICSRVEQPWRGTCFQSYGRDASGVARDQPARLLRLCRRAGAGEPDCIYGAVREIASNYSSGRPAAAFCRVAPRAYRSRCFYETGTILRVLFQTDAERRASCASFSGRFLNQCLEGAGVSR